VLSFFYAPGSVFLLHGTKKWCAAGSCTAGRRLTGGSNLAVAWFLRGQFENIRRLWYKSHGPAVVSASHSGACGYLVVLIEKSRACSGQSVRTRCLLCLASPCPYCPNGAVSYSRQPAGRLPVVAL
jgi:hypothetical protein